MEKVDEERTKEQIESAALLEKLLLSMQKTIKMNSDAIIELMKQQDRLLNIIFEIYGIDLPELREKIRSGEGLEELIQKNILAK